jgi:hypothetical protein
VIRISGILKLNLLDPWILSGWLIEVTVNTDVFFRLPSSPSRDIHDFMEGLRKDKWGYFGILSGKM